MRFDPNKSLLAGMTPAQLQTSLSSLQTAMIELAAGGKPQTVEMTGGGQHRAVTFNKADITQMQYLIRLIQAQLGIIEAPRMGVRIGFSA